MKNSKAFTLIELLIVIAIIGILASIVLVSLSGARVKARDAAIISSANSMMKQAQINSTNSGDYSAYYITNGWADTASECNAAWGSTPNPSEMRAACLDINAKNGNRGVWMASWGGATQPKASVIAYLPGADKYYCIGSHGSSSATSNGNGDGSGCGALGSWNCPGCPGDTSANGG